MFTYDYNSKSDSEYAKLCDVAYWDGSSVKTTSIDNWSISLGTPIGIVVIPSNFLPDGKARIVSLKAVDSNGNATTSHDYMYWEQSGNYVDTTLTNYTKVPITNSQQQVSGSNSYGYLPSDNFTGDTSFVDSSAKYGTTNTNKIPSPYNGSEFNTDYSKDISGYNNALSDFNGLSNTQVLVGLGNDYVAANAAYNYSDGVSNTQWYLPSAGELGFMVARLKSINSTISQLGFVAVPSTYFWSSTEYSSSDAYLVSTRNGNVYFTIKDYDYCVRPFALLDTSSGGGSNLITFTVDGTEYQAEEGMTWEDWVNSEYNPSLENGGYYICEGNTIWNAAKPILGIISTDKIIANNAYEHGSHSGGSAD